MKKQVFLIIEHCEPELSEWLLLEYKHAAKIWDSNVIFTNVHDETAAKKLKKNWQGSKKECR